MRTALLALLGSAAYATARYNVLMGVRWGDWPTYTLNKAFALAALVLLVICVARMRLSTRGADGWTVSMAGAFAAMHVVLSLMLLSPAYMGGLPARGWGSGRESVTGWWRLPATRMQKA